MKFDATTKSFLATFSIGLVGFIGTVSLCITLFVKNYADPAVLTALISITGTALGTLARGAGPTATPSDSSPSQNNNQPQPEQPKP